MATVPKNLIKGFKRPRQVTYETEEKTATYAQFVAEPYERGFGVTIGNSLRRCLLSSIRGAAIVAVRIDDVLHEFTTIPGVKEDMTDFVLNLKQVQVKLSEDIEEKVIVLEKNGQGEIKAGDIAVDDQIEIMNPDLHICFTNKEARLTITMHIITNRGYLPAERFEELREDINTILIDGMFSPVTRVNYHVENTRVGQRTDYEKLILDVWTSGAITPEDAVAQAAKILKEHFTVFINFEEEPEIEEEEEQFSEEERRLQDILNTSVDELELSVRSTNCLQSANLRTIGELVQKTEGEMLKTKNFGKKSAEEIKQKLTQFGLHLGMKDIKYVPADENEEAGDDE